MVELMDRLLHPVIGHFETSLFRQSRLAVILTVKKRTKQHKEYKQKNKLDTHSFAVFFLRDVPEKC